MKYEPDCACLTRELHVSTGRVPWCGECGRNYRPVKEPPRWVALQYDDGTWEVYPVPLARGGQLSVKVLRSGVVTRACLLQPSELEWPLTQKFDSLTDTLILSIR